MLVAEYRRRALGERVAFLCPTRQLADQVSLQAQQYGVPAVLLTGRQADYNTNDFLKYESARAVAITTYSGVFNTNPASTRRRPSCATTRTPPLTTSLPCGLSRFDLSN